MELRQWLPEAHRWFQQADAVERRFISLVKTLIVAADVAGSALPRHGQDPAFWTEQVLSRTCLETDLKEIAETRLSGFAPRDFQKKVEISRSPVTFVRGGCGSGKTVAAYLWASRNATGRKLFFCYPTTGTATEGFRDYIIPSELSAQSLLLHSRSECDLEDLLKSQEEDAPAHAIRIESLAAWDVPLVICTADLVLGLIQNNRRSLFSFPSIANGAFIFDEIHQYDERLFGALLRFLDTFQGAPILLMTASLPKDRQRAIQDLLAKRNIELQVIGGPIDLENLKRYRLEGPVQEPPWADIENMLSQGGKILWVGNTVDRCVNFAKEAQGRGLVPLPYHSRYRYCDRIERHNAVIEAFKKPGPALAMTTQVCEVSLDISADLLVSDISSVPALIQRMGRLNRRVSPEKPGEPKAAILLNSCSHLPYTKMDLDLTRAWMSKLGAGSLSQADLAAAFEALAERKEVPTVESAWLEGGPFNKAAPLREAGYTVSVIRPEDKSNCLNERSRPSRKQVTLYAIPMTLYPVERELQSWERLQHAFIAPEGRIKYSEEWGGGWENK